MANAKRLRKKRLSKLRAAYRWQLRLVKGHHYRWSREASGQGLNIWDPNNIERNYPPKYDPPRITNKAWEKNRIRVLWGLKFHTHTKRT